MPRKRPCTLIEVKVCEGAEGTPLRKAAQVFINGTQVEVEKDGIDIDYGDNEVTVVTLRIQPSEIRFNK